MPQSGSSFRFIAAKGSASERCFSLYLYNAVHSASVEARRLAKAVEAVFTGRFSHIIKYGEKKAHNRE